MCLSTTINLDGVATINNGLRPIIDPTIGHFLKDNNKTLFELIQEYNSPLNILWPHTMNNNIEAIQNALKQHIKHFEIYYGVKVNKSKKLVETAINFGIGVDVSSFYELKDALTKGAKRTRICASGPVKSDEFISALIEHGAIISIDSIEEYASLIRIKKEILDLSKTKILLRYRSKKEKTSRFGMTYHEIQHLVHKVKEDRPLFDLLGFHFHLSGYAFEDRVAAFEELIPLFFEAKEIGLNVTVIDIGGGLPIRYVKSDSYDAFLQQQSPANYRNQKIPNDFYPYGSHLQAAEWIDSFLMAKLKNSETIADFLLKNEVDLALEPGRSLVDQSAITVFKIAKFKKLSNNDGVIFVEGSSFNGCETWFNSEYLVDPIFIPAERNIPSEKNETHAYIAGHSCLGEDVITNRILTFSREPQPGDLLVFVNTAGYQMDLLENEFHRHPMPRKIVAEITKKNTSYEYIFSPDQ